jgi:hypothetical protein
MNHLLADPGVTLGCVTVGTITLLLTVLRWWKKSSSGKGENGGGGRRWSQLVPFVIAFAYGMLVVLSANSVSVLGFISRAGLWSGQGIGHAYLVWGIGGSDPHVTRGQLDLLTPGGKCILAIWTALQIAAQKWSKKQTRLYATLGAISGFCLGLSAGLAGIAAIPLASAVNASGAWYTGWVG